MQYDGLDHSTKGGDGSSSDLIGKLFQGIMPRMEKGLNWGVVGPRRGRDFLLEVAFYGDEVQFQPAVERSYIVFLLVYKSFESVLPLLNNI